MATRMQQRRGTASQWNGADPILAAGEFGFESDTNKFKIGDGINHWSDLDYFVDSNSASNPSVGSTITFEGATADAYEMVLDAGDPTADRTITLPDVSGTVITTGNLSDIHTLDDLVITGDLTVNGITTVINSTAVNVQNQVIFEGSTDNGFETTLTVVDPTADRTITFPNDSGTVILENGVSTLTNKTLTSPKINQDVVLTATSTDLNVLSGMNATTAELNVLDGITATTEQLNILADIIATAAEINKLSELTTTKAELEILHGVTASTGEINVLDGLTASQADLNKLTALSTTAEELEILHGVTASAAEINVLDGLTSSQAELNLLDGVTATTGELNILAGLTTTTEQLNMLGLVTASEAELNVLDGVTATTAELNALAGSTVSTADLTKLAGITATAAEVNILSGATLSVGELNLLDGVTATTEQINLVGSITASAAELNILDGATLSVTELNYVDGVTSAIQTQLDNKQDAVTGVSTTEIGYLDGVTSSIQNQLNGKQATVANVSDIEIGYLDGVTSAIQTQLNGKAATSHTHAISDVTSLQTSLDGKASLTGATFTGTVNGTSLILSGDLTVTGTTTTVDTQDLVVTDPMIYIGEGNSANLVDLGLVSSFNDGTYQHSGIVRDASAGTWKIFKGVTDEPTTTVNFAQGTLDDLAVKNLTAAGIVFADGTQTKQGVPSLTPIIAKTDSYTLSSLTERDSLIEVSKSTATTITIPADSAVNYPIGTTLDILQTSTGQVTIAGAAGVTVNATPGLKLRTTWSSATLLKRAANTWVVYGDLTA